MRLLILLFIVGNVLGCGDYFKCMNGYYEANIQLNETGVASENNPHGMTRGTMWAKGGGGFIRFRNDSVWRNIHTGKYYVARFDCSGWVETLKPSSVDSNYVIVGDGPIR